MTQTEAEPKSPAPGAKEGSGGHGRAPDRKERPLTKVIVRRLPPSLDQESFLSIVSPIPDYDYIYSVRGDSTLGEHSFSRVYINFANAEDVFAFKEKFDNYVFVNNRGHEYPAVVEFASFQKIPKKRGKPRADAKCGMIESDPVYLEFVESLKAQPASQEEKPEYSYQFTSESKDDKTTPLLEYIKQKRVERQRIREEKREERKKREMERKKFREDERKKRYDEKSPVKTVVIKANYGGKAPKEDRDAEAAAVVADEDKEKPIMSTSYKSKERKYEDKKFVFSKSKYAAARSDKREYADKKSDYKSRREDFGKPKHRHDDGKKEPPEQQKQFSKKVKKYSERREERKMEALKAEQKKEAVVDDDEHKSAAKENEGGGESSLEIAGKSSGDEKHQSGDGFKEDSGKSGCRESDLQASKENDPRAQRRIRNKDRPTMAIYQPGMLSKRKQVDSGDSDSKDSNANSVGKD